MKKREIKSPKWEDENKIESYYGKFFPSDLNHIVSQNEVIKKFLEENGWAFWDTCNVWELGYAITFQKYVDGVRLLFNFHWKDEVSVYWWGNMRAYFDYHPTDSLLRPSGNFEVDSITERFMTVDEFSQIESNLISAIKSQKIIK